MAEFDRRQFEQGQFQNGQFSQGEFAGNEFASNEFAQAQFTRSQFRRNSIQERRFAQARQQVSTFERRVFERRQFTIGDRIPETGQWEAIDDLGGVQFGEKIFNAEAVGQPVRVLGGTLDDVSVDEAANEASLFLAAGNCLGYLQGQVFNCEEDVEIDLIDFYLASNLKPFTALKLGGEGVFIPVKEPPDFGQVDGTVPLDIANKGRRVLAATINEQALNEVWVSRDDGLNWQRNVEGIELPTVPYSFFDIDAGSLFWIALENRVYSGNGVDPWELRYTSEAPIRSIYAKGDFVFGFQNQDVTGALIFYRSTDGGSSWQTQIFADITNAPGGKLTTSFAKGNEVIYARIASSDDGSTVERGLVSSDRGETWTRFNWAPMESPTITAAGGSGYGSHLVYAASDHFLALRNAGPSSIGVSQLWRSPNGLSWSRATEYPVAESAAPIPTYSVSGRIWLIIASNGEIHTSVRGEVFTPNQLDLSEYVDPSLGGFLLPLWGRSR